MRREFVPMTAHVVRRKPWKKRGALSSPSPSGSERVILRDPPLDPSRRTPLLPFHREDAPQPREDNSVTIASTIVDRAAAMPLKRKK